MSYNFDLNMKQIKEKQAEKNKFEEDYYKLVSNHLVDAFNADMSLNEYSKMCGDRKLLIDKVTLEIHRKDIEILDLESDCVKHEEAKGNIDEDTAVKFLTKFHKEVMVSTKRREAKFLETMISELQALKDFRILLGKEVFNDRITSRKLDSSKFSLKDINREVYNIDKRLSLIKIAALDNKYAIEVLTRDEKKKSFNEKVKTFAKKIFK